MGIFTASHKGNFEKTITNLKRLSMNVKLIDLEMYAQEAIRKLKENTPKDSKKTADSWGYTIETGKDGQSIIFTNSNLTPEGTPVVILIKYGHATRGGTWVPANDFVTPVINEIVKKINLELLRNIKII